MTTRATGVLGDPSLLHDACARVLLERAPGLTGAVEVMACDDDASDTAAFCATYDVDPADCANALVVQSRSDPAVVAVCVVLATRRLDVNRVVRQRLGTRKASFAPQDVGADLTGMVPGGISPVGLPDGIPVWIDASVMDRPRVVVGGGNRTSKLLLAPTDLVLLSGGEVVPELSLSPDAPA